MSETKRAASKPLRFSSCPDAPPAYGSGALDSTIYSSMPLSASSCGGNATVYDGHRYMWRATAKLKSEDKLPAEAEKQGQDIVCSYCGVSLTWNELDLDNDDPHKAQYCLHCRALGRDYEPDFVTVDEELNEWEEQVEPEKDCHPMNKRDAIDYLLLPLAWGYVAWKRVFK